MIYNFEDYINELWAKGLTRNKNGEERIENRLGNHSFTDGNGKFHKYGLFPNTRKELEEYIENVFNITPQNKSLNLNIIDVSNIDDFQMIFHKLRKDIVNMDLSGWNTINAEIMAATFVNMKYLEQINLSNWDIKNVMTIQDIFFNCCKIKSISLANWKIDNIVNFNGSFGNCKQLKTLDLSNWNLTYDPDVNYSNMFYHCDSLETIKCDENTKKFILNNKELLSFNIDDTKIKFEITK